MRDKIDAIWTTGAARWPSVRVDANVFATYAAEIGLSDAASPDSAADVFLACGCLQNDRGAIRELERILAANMGSFVGRIDNSPAFVDEVCQRVRERLLNATPPKLSRFTGSGPFVGWLRVVAIRVALDLKRQKSQAHVAIDETLAEQLSSNYLDPEVGLLRERYGPAYESAVREGLKQLTVRQRAVLRLYLLAGLNIDQVGNMYHVHRSTVARWISSAERSVLATVTSYLSDHHGLTISEVTSLARVIHSQIQLSLDKAL